MLHRALTSVYRYLQRVQHWDRGPSLRRGASFSAMNLLQSLSLRLVLLYMGWPLITMLLTRRPHLLGIAPPLEVRLAMVMEYVKRATLAVVSMDLVEPIALCVTTASMVRALLESAPVSTVGGELIVIFAALVHPNQRV